MPRVSAATKKKATDVKPIEQDPPRPVQVIERRIETVMVEIPLGEPPHRFDQIHIEGWLRREGAHTFARLRQALRDRGATTRDGRPVKTNPDIMRWLMEQCSAEKKATSLER